MKLRILLAALCLGTVGGCATVDIGVSSSTDLRVIGPDRLLSLMQNRDGLWNSVTSAERGMISQHGRDGEYCYTGE